MIEHENTANTLQAKGPGPRRVIKGGWKNPQRQAQMLGVGIPAFQKEPDARILRPLLLEAKSPEQIGDELGYKPSISKIEGREVRRHKSIRKRVKKILGFEELRLLHGDVMNQKLFVAFHRNFGEPSNKQLAAALGIGERHAWDLLREKKPDKMLTVELCEKIRDCERRFVAALMSDRGHRENHFKTAVPDLIEKLNAATLAISRFREVIESNEATQNNVLDTMAAEARKEVKAVPRVRRALCVLPAIVPWLRSNLAELERKSKDLAVLFLAHEYSVKIWVVQKAAYSSEVEASPGGEIRALLFPLGAKYIQPKAIETAKRTRPSKKISARTIEKGVFCDRVIEEMRQIKRLCLDGGRTIVEIQIGNPDFAAWKVRDTLPQEDRDAFNCPRGWGAPVGYAENILGKHYGKHPETVRNWVKDARAAKRILSA
jgi:hypothetical protein